MFSFKKIALTTVTLLAINTAAQADILAAGVAFGGPTQTIASCGLYNAGSGPVTITSNAIIREPNISLPLFLDTCGVLAPGSSCSIAAGILNNFGHSCRMVISPSGADVRGNFEVRESGLGRVLNNLQLR